MKFLAVTDAQRIVLETAQRLGSERVRLEQSIGRVLAADIVANRDLPPYAVSAMDGFALRSADVVQIPATLEIIEDIKAGDLPQHTLQAGQCARIMTGAPLPAGADAVLRMEDTKELSAVSVEIRESVKAGHDVRPRGENMTVGQVVLTTGTEITPGVIGILATVKAAEVEVFCRPRVAILSTGNELEGMDEPVDVNRIPESNSYALMGQMQMLGLAPALLGIARDDEVETERCLTRGLAYDVLLVSGGSSVGVHDLVRPALEKLGVEMKFWRVAMKPGHPLAFGAKGRTLVFGLPGNPVSSMVCVEEFVVPALRQMMGNRQLFRRTVSARLGRAIKHKPGRTEFVRVQLQREGADCVVNDTGNQSSGVLLSMAQAEGLLVVPAESAGLAAGGAVSVQLLDGSMFQNEAGLGE
ncbi:MAG: gephyrin-like molybdotransferase Glp [Sideroxydans sp.]|jgi:molybdopterin molybdotransferase